MSNVNVLYRPAAFEAINNCSLEYKEKPGPEPCSTISLKFDVGPHTFELWCTLKHSFACHSNEGFLVKLLEIAQEYLLSKQSASEQGHSDGDSGHSSSTALAEPAAPQGPESVEPKARIKKQKGLKAQPSGAPCRYCDANHSHLQCLVHQPQERIFDAEGNWDGFCKSQQLATLSLPNCLAFASAQQGIVTKVGLKPFTQFGPLIGATVKEVDVRDDCNMRHVWELQLARGNVYMDTEDPQRSNWLRYVRPAPTRLERNLSVVIQEESLYLVSIRALKAGEELLYWQDTFAADSRKRSNKTVCGGCNMTFAHPLYYKVHCSLFHDMRYSLTIRKYHCKVCGAAVLGKENIRKHATEQHNGKGAYQCQFCSKFFLRLNYLDMHRTYGCASNPQRSKSLCDFCGRNFCQPQKLKIHIKRMHSSLTDVLKDFQCTKCLKVLGSRAALQRHLKEVHDKQGDATYGCQVCAKHFQNKSNLKIHMLTHSGIKPFKCVVGECAAAFTTKQCLQLHYRKVHSFDENSMPKIERAVSYTFQAYSGDQKSCAAQSSGGSPQEPAPQKAAAKGEKKWLETDHKYSSNASLLVEAALDSVCNDASLDIDVEVSHNWPEAGELPEVDYQLQESQDMNLISPSVNDHISVTDELEGEIKDTANMEMQYGQLPEEQFRPGSRHSVASLKETALGREGGARRFDFGAAPLSSDESGAEDPSRPLDRPSLRVKSSIRMHDYFRRLWFEENNQTEAHPADAEVPDIGGHLADKPDKPKYEPELAADLRSRFEADLDSRARHYEPPLDPDLGRQHAYNPDLGPMEAPDFRAEQRHFEPVALTSSDLQGLDMSTRGFHNYSSNMNRFHPVYPDLDLRLNYTPPPPYDLVRVVSLDLTPPGRRSVDLSLRGLPLHQITNSRLLSEHGLSNKHRIFDLNNLPGADQLGDEPRLLDHPRPLLGESHLLSAQAVGGGSLAFGGYSGVAQAPYHGSSPVNYHPYSTYYP